MKEKENGSELNLMNCPKGGLEPLRDIKNPPSE
jgi:hypothetical protein